MSQIESFPQTNRATPILKWAGGKTKLIPQLQKYFPRKYNRYFEPFLGGGAIFFHLRPNFSYLFDLNHELIEVYQVVRDNPLELLRALQVHKNEEQYFYGIRGLNPSELTSLERAARFIYLNKTCYNGLYRVNKSGEFNVPFGRYTNPTIADEKGILAASAILKAAHLEVADFEIILNYATENDLVYFDPPYQPLNTTSNFTNYTPGGFTINDQYRLARVYETLHKRGCILMLSNSDTSLIRDLYSSYQIHEIYAKRVINSNPLGRGEITELLITNLND